MMKGVSEEQLRRENITQRMGQLQSEMMQIAQEGMKQGNSDVMMKAWDEISPIPFNSISGVKSVTTDPINFARSFNYKEKPFALTYNLLRAMSRTPVITSILRTRINQVAAFAEPQADRFAIGFRIGKRNRHEELKPGDHHKVNEIERFLLSLGEPTDFPYQRDTFENFLRKITNDSLTFDQMTFECVLNRRGQPNRFLATDAATYRLADRARQKNTPPKFQDFYVQVINARPYAKFKANELCFGIRNPRTDIRCFGYGYGELEDLVNTVTAQLWADEYNRRFFRQGSAPKGMIKVAPGINQQKLQEFRRQWLAQIAGVYNSWRTPIVESDKLEYVKLHESNKDMEYKAWQEYLIKVSCSIFQIDPLEIGFDLKTGQSTLGERDNEYKIKWSRDKGLYPLLKFIASKINLYLMWPRWPEYSFGFAGLNANTEKEELEIIEKKVSTVFTIDEVRADLGKKPLEQINPDMDGKIIANSTVTAWPNQKAMLNQEGGEEGGGLGDEGIGGEEPGVSAEAEGEEGEE